MITKKIAAFAAAASMMATMASVQVSAAGSATFSVIASNTTISAGDPTSIQVKLDATDIASWSSYINYDSNAFDIEWATPGTDAVLNSSNTGASWFSTENKSFSGTTVYSITFKAKPTANGVYTFSVSASDVYDSDEQPGAIAVGEVTVTVTGGTDSTSDSSAADSSSESDSSSTPDSSSEPDSSSIDESSSVADSSSATSSTTSSSASSAASSTAASSAAASSAAGGSTSSSAGGKTDNPKTGAASVAGAAVLAALGVIVVAKKRK